MDSKIESMPEASAHGTRQLERATRRPPARHQSRRLQCFLWRRQASIFSNHGANLFLVKPTPSCAKCELAPDHPLYSVRLHPLGHSGASDDAIFEAEDDRIFQVHLTLSGKTEKTPLPRFQAYVNTAEWIQTLMLPANEDYRG